jgi:DNA recombination protein Rad52
MNPNAFSVDQIQELSQPLSVQAVKTRDQSGRTLSYVEGWHVISEANRIFGYGCWDQELRDIKCVSERERKVGQAKKDGWGVSYIATVRITTSGTFRDGVGAGHGIDVDFGQAHESAIKEAATDAMKRAFMTFGNQFGLSLYDKQQRNVEDKPLNFKQVSESEKATQKFVSLLHTKMQQAGINRDGIRTLMKILQVNEFEEVKDLVRERVLTAVTPEYAAKLNIGQNSRGEQVVQVVAKGATRLTADLHEAADRVLS